VGRLKNIKKEHGFLLLMLLSLVFAVVKIVIHLGFILLPVLFLGLGFFSYTWSQRKGIYLFLFFLPLVNSLPDIFFNGYPFNYMGIVLFYLSGIVLASIRRKERLTFPYRWAGPYLFFLVILWVSVLFLFLRWSNITPSALAFGQDTPVGAVGVSVSFASIFPVITLFLFSVSPYILPLIRQNRLPESGVLRAILLGYTFSFVIGLYQKFVDGDFLAQRWWGEKLNQQNAGFSDFNAFGFFSGVLFLYFLVSLLENISKKGNQRFYALGGAMISLGGIFLSGCRTGFLFVIIALVYLLWTKRIKTLHKLAGVLVFLSMLVLLGGTLKNRMLSTLNHLQEKEFIAALDEISNGRIAMIDKSIPLLKKYPLTGVGGGNFLFYLKYRYLGKTYWEDLPLNQYLLILDETGIIGLAVFLVFLARLLGQKRKKSLTLLLLTMLAALLFNFFFWFPELLLLFWIIAAFSSGEKEGKTGPKSPLLRVLAPLLLLFFIGGNILYFSALHPRAWAKEKNYTYSYGFWYPEKDPAGFTYRWTTGEAGIYLYLDKAGESSPIRLYCGAPVHLLDSTSQAVAIYWQGKLYRREVFFKNRELLFTIKGRPFSEGFLEFRIKPTFNLKKLKISDERRDLGVRLYE